MSPEGKKQPADTDQIESLRLILEGLSGMPTTYDEAQEVGDSLLQFFELLAEDPGVEVIDNV